MSSRDMTAQTTNKKCILHIGMRKTGTTSIQQTLFENRDRLAKFDIGYFAGLANHTILSTCFNPALEDTTAMVLAYGPLAEDRQQGAADLRRDLFEHFDQSPFSTEIISGEGFIELGESGAKTLKRDLSPYFSDIKIICYARDPLAGLASCVQQIMKIGLTIDEICSSTLDAELVSSPLHGKRHAAIPGFADSIEPFIKAFGRDNVIIRPYERDTLYGNDIVEDFCQIAIGKSAVDLGLNVVRGNEGLDSFNVAILDAVNRRVPKFNDYYLNPDYPHDLVPLLAKSGRLSPFRLPDFDWPLFAEITKDDRAWLADISDGQIDYTRSVAPAAPDRWFDNKEVERQAEMLSTLVLEGTRSKFRYSVHAVLQTIAEHPEKRFADFYGAYVGAMRETDPNISLTTVQRLMRAKEYDTARKIAENIKRVIADPAVHVKAANLIDHINKRVTQASQQK